VNKKILISAAVLILIILLGIGFILMKPRSSSPEQSIAQPEPTTASASQTTKQSLRSLLAAPGNQTCEYSDPESGYSGKAYLSGGKMRADATIVNQGQTLSSHTYTDGDTIYVWADGQASGMKMSLKNITPAPSGQPENNVDLDKQIDYKCSSWNPDAALFTLPENVEFKDFSSLITVPTAAAGTMPNTTDKCSVCNSLSGEAKTQCVTALGC
jgi:hypothetical protein